MRTVGKIALYGSAALGLGFVVLLLVYVWPGGLLTGWGISAPSRYDQLSADIQGLNAQIANLEMAAATEPEAPAPEPSPIPEAPTAVPDQETAYVAPEVNSAVPVNWTLVNVARFFDTVQVAGLTWELPKGTYFSTDKSNGRYEAHETTDNLGGSYGWCSATTPWQPDCPPWLGLYHVEVTDGVEAQMDIATRVMIDANDDGQGNFQWRFNDLLREGTEKSLMDDYNVAASQGQLGLFVATADPLMDPATLTYLDQEYLVGYGCWDCLADTSGKDAPVVSLDDQSIGHMGPDTPTLGDSLQPAYVIPVPSPKDEPAFSVDLMLEIPKGTTVVVWFGRYDVSDPPG